MLRITVQAGEGTQTIKLAGGSPGLGFEDFNRSWRSLAPSLSSKELHLDLCGVAFVNARGRELLRDINQKANAASWLIRL